MSIREGSGATTVAMTPAAAFAYLADPRHAPAWFAGVTLAEPPEGPQIGAPREGMTWRFVQTRGQPAGGRPRVTPVEMAVYEPPSRVVWRTRFAWPRTNLAWELRFEPHGEPDSEPLAESGAEPGTVAGEGAGEGQRPAEAAPAPDAGRSPHAPTQHATARLTFTIRIEPGPLGWATLLVAAPFSRNTLAARAQRAVERAREALVEQQAAGGGRSASPMTRKGTSPKGRKPHQRKHG